MWIDATVPSRTSHRRRWYGPGTCRVVAKKSPAEAALSEGKDPVILIQGEPDDPPQSTTRPKEWRNSAVSRVWLSPPPGARSRGNAGRGLGDADVGGVIIRLPASRPIQPRRPAAPASAAVTASAPSCRTPPGASSTSQWSANASRQRQTHQVFPRRPRLPPLPQLLAEEWSV